MIDIIEITNFCKKNKINHNPNYLFKLSFKQLKALYNYFNLKNHKYKEQNDISFLIKYQNPNLTKSQEQYEKNTWIMNIKNIYELINKNFLFKPKFTFYFEYLLSENKRIDILVKNKKKSLIIECSHNYTNELLKKKENQLNTYLKLYAQNSTSGVVYINDYSSENKTISNTIKALKKLK